MYSVDDIRTPRDRVSEQLLRRLLESEGESVQPECTCRGCEEPEARGSMHDVGVMQRNADNCGCARGAQNRSGYTRESEPMNRCRMLEGQPLAMVYSPCQIWRGIYAPDMALRRGTLFKELDMPWGVENRRGGCSRGK